MVIYLDSWNKYILIYIIILMCTLHQIQITKQKIWGIREYVDNNLNYEFTRPYVSEHSIWNLRNELV